MELNTGMALNKAEMERFSTAMQSGGTAMTYPAMQHIPLTSAYLCQDCNSVGNYSRQCPACASAALMSLASVLGREAETEAPRQVSKVPYLTLAA